MKTLIAILVVVLVAGFALAAPDKPETMACTTLEGKTAVEIGKATDEEINRGDIPLRCVMENGTVMYYTVPFDEYEWRGCRKTEFKLPVKFFARLQGAQFVADGCEIYQRRECTPAELASAACGERLPLGTIPCRPPR
jgi:hypothetical protein